MKELRTILHRLEELRRSGESCALATVVSVHGSAYRRPGARMLFSKKGREAGFVSATTGSPGAWVQAVVTARAGIFGSVTVPVSVTIAPAATLCAAPASTEGGPTGGSTSTLVVAVAVAVPLLVVTVKPSMSGGMPTVSAGAVKVATASPEFVREISGSPGAWVHAYVSGNGGTLGSVAVAVRVTDAPEVTTCGAPALTVGGSTVVNGSITSWFAASATQEIHCPA